MEPRLNPAVSAQMLHAVWMEQDIETLLILAVDQTLPRDVRRNAGERLETLDRRGEVLHHIRAMTDADLLGKLSRCGMLGSKFVTFAKARIATVKDSGNVIEQLIARLEEQNRLLRNLRVA